MAAAALSVPRPPNSLPLPEGHQLRRPTRSRGLDLRNGGGGGGGDSGDPGIQLEGPGERTETSSWSPKDVPPRCLGSRWTLLEVSWIQISLSKILLA